MMRNFVYITSILIIILVCLSCEKREAYYRFSELKDTSWSKFDTLYYKLDSLDIDLNVPYDVTIELVNSSEYPYQNLWLYVWDDFDTTGITLEKKHYKLADNLGKWHGAGFGSSYQLSLFLKKDIVFSERREYLLKIVHGMRDEPLVGIEKVGLKIHRSED